MKHRLFAILTVLLTSVAGIVALEYAVRWLMPQFDPSGHVRFEVNHAEGVVLGPRNRAFRQIKNTGDFDVTVRFNRWGLRDVKDFTEAKPEDLFFVGDSHAFGWGVEEAERTSNQLGRLLGRPVYNLGIPVDVPGYDALLEYARRHGAPVKRVILLLTSESDIANYRAAPRSVAAASANRFADGFREIKGYLTAHSALYFVFTAAVHASPLLVQLAESAGIVAPVHEGAWFRTFDPNAVTATVDALAAIAARYETTGWWRRHAGCGPADARRTRRTSTPT